MALHYWQHVTKHHRIHNNDTHASTHKAPLHAEHHPCPRRCLCRAAHMYSRFGSELHSAGRVPVMSLPFSVLRSTRKGLSVTGQWDACWCWIGAEVRWPMASSRSARGGPAAFRARYLRQCQLLAGPWNPPHHSCGQLQCSSGVQHRQALLLRALDG
jgi:hypothetical protein